MEKNRIEHASKTQYAWQLPARFHN